MDELDDLIHNLYSTPLSCGKNLFQLTTYDNLSMIWITHASFQTFLRNLLKEEKTTRQSSRSRKLTIYKRAGIYLELLFDVALHMISSVLLFIYDTRSKNPPSYPTVLLYSHDLQWRKMRDAQKNITRKTDIYFDAIIQKAQDKFTIITTKSIDYDEQPFQGIRKLREKLKLWNIPIKPLNIYWRLDVWKKKYKSFKFFKQRFQDLQRDQVFRKLCRINGKDFSKEILHELDFYFTMKFPRGVGYIALGRNMLKFLRPQLVMLADEYIWKPKSYIVIAAKLEGVPSLALQHGIIYPTHTGYKYQKKDISPKGHFTSPYAPLPDKTVVYGTYHKHLLTEISAYPKQSVLVTGQPRYDALYEAKETYSKQEYIKRYGINPKERIVLWTTQLKGTSDEENALTIETVCTAIKSLKNVCLVIKQHPDEGQEYTALLQEYTKRFDVNAIIPSRFSDTNEHLFAADVVIGKTSTTLMEAVILQKPAIVLNLSGQPDEVEYVPEKVALGVYQKDTLAPAIQKLLIDDAELASHRENYIERYLYKIDGKSTERVLDVMDNMILTYQKPHE